MPLFLDPHICCFRHGDNVSTVW
uniref:Uncharacterized protein n=1 Tax=Solanum lycopersicum TaxID=4081 RepID=A0A3Q7FWM5_SOLLC